VVCSRIQLSSFYFDWFLWFHRKKGKDISALVESVQPDIIMGTETWLSEDVCSSELFDTSLGFDIHRNDRVSDPHGGVFGSLSLSSV
jgi:hypothetical protein